MVCRRSRPILCSGSAPSSACVYGCCGALKMSGTEQEVLDAAVEHAVSAHGHKNSPELREQIKSMLKDESD